MQIWKYPLDILGNQLIEMPQGAKLLSVQMQGDQPCLWTLVNPLATRVLRGIYIVGTGHDLTDIYHTMGRHIGTFQVAGIVVGALVFHAFEKKL